MAMELRTDNPCLALLIVVLGNGPSVLMLRLFCLDVSRFEEVRGQPKPKVAMISECIHN
ncbi:hypothetical protein J45TS6_23090 [Paenibacillus sp. J45TS6]|nr:hypothetical protein J45TS6_23090 [Paenibacillus sp. J45TS6]